MTLGGIIERKKGPRLAMAMGCVLLSLCVFITVFGCRNYYAVALIYGLLGGCGTGITYNAPMSVCMKWFPKSKGLVNGIIVGGYGFGSFVFSQIQLAIINPNNEKPADGDYYSGEQVKKLPLLFIVTGIVYIALQTIGLLLITRVPNEEELAEINVVKEGEKKLDTNAYSTKEAVSSLSFWILWSTFAFNGVAVSITSSYWKVLL